jgi:hypothetical protein
VNVLFISECVVCVSVIVAQQSARLLEVHKQLSDVVSDPYIHTEEGKSNAVATLE